MVIRGGRIVNVESHMQTLMISRLGFNQNYYTFTLILLTTIVMCSQIPRTEFVDDRRFEMISSWPHSES